jgi:hypothetical protein
MTTPNWTEIHRIVTEDGKCLDDLHDNPDTFRGAAAPGIIYLIAPAVFADKLLVFGVKVSTEASEALGTSSYDAQSTLLCHLATRTPYHMLCLVVNDGKGQLETWHWHERKDTRDFIAKGEELGFEGGSFTPPRCPKAYTTRPNAQTKKEPSDIGDGGPGRITAQKREGMRDEHNKRECSI